MITVLPFFDIIKGVHEQVDLDLVCIVYIEREISEEINISKCNFIFFSLLLLGTLSNLVFFNISQVNLNKD